MSPSVTHVHQWSGPRSMSTAAMYSWYARGDCTCVDEPLYAHFLRETPRAYRPYRDELMRVQSPDGEKVVKEVLTKAYPTPLAFFKHMAKQAMSLNMSWAVAPTTRHIILIRDPMRQLASFASAPFIENPSVDELSLPQLVALHTQLTELCDHAPVVIDADDLSKNPVGMLHALCAELGVPYSAAMLAWSEGPKPCDGMWAKHWYDSVHRTTGWLGKHSATAYRTLSTDLLPVLRAAEPFYNYLRTFAIRPKAEGGAEGGDAPTAVIDHGVVRSLLPDPRNADLLVWIGPPGRGRLVPRELARVSVFDSAVQGGDAVWEGLRVYRGRVFKLETHLSRLYASARAMDFAHVHTPEEVRDAIFQTLAANGMRDGVHIRLTLTRGEKTTSSMNPKFNVYGCTLIVLAEWKPAESVATYDNEKGIELITAANRRNPPSCVDSKIHHNNLINNILPKIQANYAGAADAIMLDVDGFVAETNATNLFMFKDDTLLTPAADHCLPGITRATVLSLAEELDIAAVERRISLAEFHAADEVFTTGTMGELTPVVRIDGRAIGDGAVGKRTTQMRQAFAQLPDRDDPEHAELPEF